MPTYFEKIATRISPNITLLYALLITISISCSEEEELIGKWDDKIKLSEKSISFTAGSDSVLITTEGEWWWIDEIKLNDLSYSYYNDESIDLESDVYLIEESNFVVERRDANTLFISLDENLTGSERTLNIYLQAGNYFDAVSIVQSPN